MCPVPKSRNTPEMQGNAGFNPFYCTECCTELACSCVQCLKAGRNCPDTPKPISVQQSIARKSALARLPAGAWHGLGGGGAGAVDRRGVAWDSVGSRGIIGRLGGGGLAGAFCCGGSLCCVVRSRRIARLRGVPERSKVFPIPVRLSPAFRRFRMGVCARGRIGESGSLVDTMTEFVTMPL